MSQWPGGGPDYITPPVETFEQWLEAEVRSAEERWRERAIDSHGYSRGYWDALSDTLDTLHAYKEGKQPVTAEVHREVRR